MESFPWDRVLVDIIGPYKIKIEVHEKPLILDTLTTTDPETGRFKIIIHKIHRKIQYQN